MSFSIGDRVKTLYSDEHWDKGEYGTIIIQEDGVWLISFDDQDASWWCSRYGIELIQEPLSDSKPKAIPTHRVDNKQLTEGTIETLMAIVGSLNTKKVGLEDEIDSLLVTVGYLRKKLDAKQS